VQKCLMIWNLQQSTSRWWLTVASGVISGVQLGWVACKLTQLIVNSFWPSHLGVGPSSQRTTSRGHSMPPRATLCYWLETRPVSSLPFFLITLLIHMISVRSRYPTLGVSTCISVHYCWSDLWTLLRIRAKKMSKGFKGSVVLTQDSAGVRPSSHLTLASCPDKPALALHCLCAITMHAEICQRILHQWDVTWAWNYLPTGLAALPEWFSLRTRGRISVGDVWNYIGRRQGYVGCSERAEQDGGVNSKIILTLRTQSTGLASALEM